MSDVVHSQFFRIEGYGVEPRRRRGSWACISGIAAEAGRLPGACRHLAEVRPPKILHGMTPVEAGRIATERALLAVDRCGRKLRRDGVAIFAAVLSYPVPRETVEASDGVLERDLYEDWRGRALSWLRDRFGPALLSVVEHADEPHLHLHAFVVPDLGSDRHLRLEAVHPGRAAIARVVEKGGSKGAQRSAYIEAMRRLQDDFHRAVGEASGHQRLGPRRQRRERPLHLLIRSAEARKTELEQDLAARKRELDEEYEQKRRTAESEISAEIEARYAGQYADAIRAVKLLDARRHAARATIAALETQIEALTKRLNENGLAFRS